MLGSPKYAYVKFLLINLYLLLSARCGWGLYSIPDVQFQAFKPKGLRVYIPHADGIRLFAFHGRVNGQLQEIEPGELSKDVSEPTKQFWVYEDPNVELRIGDYIGYWVFVQHNYYGYRRDNMTWEVKELVEKTPLDCQISVTTVNGKAACKGAVVFQDSFDTLDKSKWVVEQYIPTNGPNFEFNYYSPECVKAKNNQLWITPIPKQNEFDIRGTLDLRQGCTSENPDECYYKQQAAFYLPPVTSGRISSKFSFKFGKFEIVAKLPCGDWICPEITLTPKDAPKKPKKIYIAYSRGNSELRGADGADIGGKLLFSGPSGHPEEPKRSAHLASKLSNEPYCQKTHKYSIVWNSDEILSYIDDEHFGKIDIRDGADDWDMNNDEFYINLGVSVGGINDFPNDFTSGRSKKPWRNKDVRQLKDFFQARNQWLQTWSNSSSALAVDSVRVYAL